MTQTRRRRSTAAEMAPLVAAWRRGEGTQAEVAARVRMPSSTFAWWCGRLGGRQKGPAGGFVAVDVGPERVAAAPAPLELVLEGGAVVRVPAGFDGETLERLVAALSRRTC